MDTETADLHWQIRQMFHYLRPYMVVDKRQVRIGSVADGGYIMLDDFAELKIAYSLGIGVDVNWDLAIAERGLTLQQYDHTVNGPPISHPNFQFNKLGIGPTDCEEFISLSTALKRNGHQARDDLVLKIDIEGSEWATFDDLSGEIFQQFQQIVIEYHGFLRANEPEWLVVAQRVLSRLYRTHAVHHVHANNWGEFRVIANVAVPDVLEVSYVRRDRVRLAPSSAIYPTALDAPCHPDRPDIFLGNFVFI